MIHDPLCSNEGDPFRTGWCNVCILIKAVREDESARIKTGVEALPYITDERWAKHAPITPVEYRRHVLAIIDGGN